MLAAYKNKNVIHKTNFNNNSQLIDICFNHSVFIWLGTNNVPIPFIHLTRCNNILSENIELHYHRNSIHLRPIHTPQNLIGGRQCNGKWALRQLHYGRVFPSVPIYRTIKVFESVVFRNERCGLHCVWHSTAAIVGQHSRAFISITMGILSQPSFISLRWFNLSGRCNEHFLSWRHFYVRRVWNCMEFYSLFWF